MLPARRSRLGLIPADYAEKTMNSLLSLHEGLMAEKERALDLTRRLDSVQQDRAELAAYVRLLEIELARSGGPILGAACEEGPISLKHSVQTLVRVLATPAPRGTSAATASSEGRTRPAASPPAPRPPRPSAAYRAPTGPRGLPGEQAETSTPDAGAPAAEDRVAWRSCGVGDEGWRQW